MHIRTHSIQNLNVLSNFTLVNWTYVWTIDKISQSYQYKLGRRLKNQAKIEKEQINQKLPLWNTFLNISVGYINVDNVEDIIHKAKQRGRAMSYINGIPKLITKFSSTDKME